MFPRLEGRVPWRLKFELTSESMSLRSRAGTLSVSGYASLEEKGMEITHRDVTTPEPLHSALQAAKVQ
jgi:hypothetical protein